jgi:hypothetical protein
MDSVRQAAARLPVAQGPVARLPVARLPVAQGPELLVLVSRPAQASRDPQVRIPVDCSQDLPGPACPVQMVKAPLVKVLRALLAQRKVRQSLAALFWDRQEQTARPKERS